MSKYRYRSRLHKNYLKALSVVVQVFPAIVGHYLEGKCCLKSKKLFSFAACQPLLKSPITYRAKMYLYSCFKEMNTSYLVAISVF